MDFVWQCMKVFISFCVLIFVVGILCGLFTYEDD